MLLDEAVLKCEYGAKFSDEEYDELQVMLETLRDYCDKNKMVVKVDCLNLQEFKDMAVNHINKAYNKAVDDTVKVIKGLRVFTILEEKEIDKVAEQLKERGYGID